VLVRDTKDNGHGLVLSFPSDAWRTFLSNIKLDSDGQQP
jgi:hypothetical protein